MTEIAIDTIREWIAVGPNEALEDIRRFFPEGYGYLVKEYLGVFLDDLEKNRPALNTCQEALVDLLHSLRLSAEKFPVNLDDLYRADRAIRYIIGSISGGPARAMRDLRNDRVTGMIVGIRKHIDEEADPAEKQKQEEKFKALVGGLERRYRLSPASKRSAAAEIPSAASRSRRAVSSRAVAIPPETRVTAPVRAASPSRAVAIPPETRVTAPVRPASPSRAVAIPPETRVTAPVRPASPASRVVERPPPTYPAASRRFAEAAESPREEKTEAFREAEAFQFLERRGHLPASWLLEQARNDPTGPKVVAVDPSGEFVLKSRSELLLDRRAGVPYILVDGRLAATDIDRFRELALEAYPADKQLQNSLLAAFSKAESEGRFEAPIPRGRASLPRLPPGEGFYSRQTISRRPPVFYRGASRPSAVDWSEVETPNFEEEEAGFAGFASFSER